MFRRVSILILFVLLGSLLLPQSAQAIAFGCSSAKKDAEMYSSRALIGQKLELKYYNQGNYSDAFRFFQGAVNDYYLWNKSITNSPKCFTKTYVSEMKKSLKSVSINYTMASRYGQGIASKNNYGSSDPCFKFLGQDSAYLNCSMGYATKDYNGYVE